VNLASSTRRGRRVVIEHDVPARMRDGVVLRANVYRPSDDGAYPVLLSRQPYDKNTNINLVYADPVRLAAAGYLVVMQDVRGRYASDGDFDPGVHEFEDGYDTVQWAAGLPGSNGRVGTWGRSYHAETQWRAAVTGPPALRSMVLGVSKFHYNLEAQERPGGAHEGSRLGWYQFQIGAEALRRRWIDDPARAAEEQRLLAETTARLASGELFDLLPLRQLGDLPGSVLGEVIAAMDRPPDAPLNRRPWPSDTYDVVRADTFHIGGWYDIFTKGTLDQYQAMAAAAARSRRRPPRLLVGPWTHSSFVSRQGEVDFGSDASGADLGGTGGLNAEHLRWFGATLKGDDQGLVDVPPVRLNGGELLARLRPVPGPRTAGRGLASPSRRRTASRPCAAQPPRPLRLRPVRPSADPGWVDYAAAPMATRPRRPTGDRDTTRRTVLHQRSPGRPVHGDRRGVGDAVCRLFGR
jgi:uncharacterized protein